MTKETTHLIMLLGVGRLLTALALSSEVWIPSLTRVWPMDFNYLLRNEYLDSFILSQASANQEKT